MGDGTVKLHWLITTPGLKSNKRELNFDKREFIFIDSIADQIYKTFRYASRNASM